MKKRFKKVYIEITNGCNLNCSFCAESKRTKKMLSIEEFEEIISKIKEYTNLVTFHVKGEPLLHPNLKEFLDICDENNILVNITTNGSLLKENISILKEAKALRQLNLSIHSIYDKNILKNVADVEKFQKEYMDNLFLSVRDIVNVNKIYISYRLWNLANEEEKLKNKYVLNLLGQEYKKHNLEQAILLSNSVSLDNNIYLNQDIEFKWPNIDDEDISNIGTCQGLKSQIAILSNGDVVPCCLDQEANILLGNIFASSLDEIVSSTKSINILNSFNENKLIESLCKKCDYIKKFENK